VGDVRGAARGYERSTRGGKGLPEEQAANERLTARRSDAPAQTSVKAQKSLEDSLALPAKSKKDKEARSKALEDFAKKNDGSFAGNEAKRVIESESPKKE